MNDRSEPRSIVPFFVTIGMLLSHLVAGLVVLVVLVKVVPNYLRFLDDFEAELPAMTQAVIHLSMLTAAYWYLVLPGLALGDGAVLFSCDVVSTRLGWFKAYWHTAVLLAAILLLGFTAIALGMPFGRIMTRLT